MIDRSIFGAASFSLLLALGACNDQPMLVRPAAPESSPAGTTGAVTIGLEVSALEAPAESAVRVAIVLGSPDSTVVAALQGRIGFDASRLRYVGQAGVDQTLTVVNDAAAPAGEVSLVSFRMDGLATEAAVLEFEVLGRGYAAGLFYESRLLVGLESTPIAAVVAPEVIEATAWQTHGPAFAGATPEELAAVAGYDLASELGGPLPVQAQTVRIGDCNGDSSVDALDLVAIARVAVGSDPVPTDPNDLRLCDVDLSGVLDVLDVLDVSRFAVGLSALFGGPLGQRLEAMTVGRNHTCALNATGAAHCWGQNAFGQLGDGSSNTSFTPVAVAGGHTFTSIQAGEAHNCGITTSGATYCWGRNNDGQLGDGGTVDSSVPAQLTGGHAFVAVADMWDDHGCGLLANGDAWCWGNAWLGALGNNVETATPTPTPVAVAGGPAFSDIAAAWHTTCGLDSAGQTHCWGVYGPGSPGTRGVPATVATGHVFTQIDVGTDHICGIDGDGAAWCWAPQMNENDRGEFGDGNWGNAVPFVPVQTAGGHTWARITTGFDHTCALDTDGQAWCWGEADVGQIGDGTLGSSLCVFDTPCQTTPSAVAGGHTFTTIDASFDHSCAIDVAGRVWCWGSNSNGQLGVDDPPLLPFLPAAADPVVGATFASLSIGGHPCGMSTGGQALCWGNNVQGQLGNGSGARFAATPQAVSGGVGLTQVVAGGSHSCGLDAGGAAYCWGQNFNGQLGNGSTVGEPEPVSVAGGPRSVSSLSSITAGSTHTCGLDGASQAFCWGSNTWGELGDDTNVGRLVPDTVAIETTFTEIHAGAQFACGLEAGTGTAWCWGRGLQGQLGNGANMSEVGPVSTGAAFTSLSIGALAWHACGLNASNEIWCWGEGASGQLGDGSSASSNVPVQVSGGRTFVSVRVGFQHTCAGDDQGISWCWGTNASGQLGDGSQNDSAVPVQVQSPVTFVDIVAGSASSCGIAAGGATYCWGSNAAGLLGLGTWPVALEPVQVQAF